MSGTTRCRGAQPPSLSQAGHSRLDEPPSQQQQWSPGGLQLAAERGAKQQSVFYRIFQETRMFGWFYGQETGFFTRVLLGTALSAVAPARLYFILWASRAYIVTHLGLVLHRRGPVHLCGVPLVPGRGRCRHAGAARLPRVPAATERRCNTSTWCDVLYAYPRRNTTTPTGVTARRGNTSTLVRCVVCIPCHLLPPHGKACFTWGRLT